MAARKRIDVIQISRQRGHTNMRITEENHAHYHTDDMGQTSDHSSRMLQNFLERWSIPKKSHKTLLAIELIYF